MSTTEATKAERWADKLRVEMARDLREISHLFLDLHAEAANKHDDPDLPGGTAMVLLAPSADPEAWGYAQMSALMGRTLGHGLDELDSDPLPPLLVLSRWVDVIREERDQPTALNATISREVDYLRKSIEWTLSRDEGGDWVFLAVDDLASDLRKVRAQLENVLHDGVRQDRGAPCLTCKMPLVKVWATSAASDHWTCKTCDDIVTPERYKNNVREGYLKHATELTATDMLEKYRIKAGTLLVWAQRGKVKKHGKDGSGRQLYNVADAVAARDAKAAEVAKVTNTEPAA